MVGVLAAALAATSVEPAACRLWVCMAAARSVRPDVRAAAAGGGGTRGRKRASSRRDRRRSMASRRSTSCRLPRACTGDWVGELDERFEVRIGEVRPRGRGSGTIYSERHRRIESADARPRASASTCRLARCHRDLLAPLVRRWSAFVSARCPSARDEKTRGLRAEVARSSHRRARRRNRASDRAPAHQRRGRGAVRRLSCGPPKGRNSTSPRWREQKQPTASSNTDRQRSERMERDVWRGGTNRANKCHTRRRERSLASRSPTRTIQTDVEQAKRRTCRCYGLDK